MILSAGEPTRYRHLHARFRGGSCFSRMLWSVFFLLLLCPVVQAAEATEHLTILTSFPSKFYTPFVETFERLHPDTQILVLNKKTTAAIDEILRGNERNFDLFWSSSADAFDLLKSAQRLRKIEIKRNYPIVSFSPLTLDDPDGYFYGFALSGVGWMWNSQYLKKERLPEPVSWSDLSDPVYYGHLAMSTPSRSGTTHLIVENFLQNLGWEKGWAQLLLMSGNLATVSARSFSVPEGVISGRFGIGLVIDFLAQAQKKSTIHFRYGQPIFLVPAGIAALQDSQNAAGADQFIDFVLSKAGQKILLQPEINRLPVSQELFLISQPESTRLMQTIDQNELRQYDVQLSMQRYHLVNQLFDRMITFKLRERRNLWKRMIDLESRFGSDNPRITPLKIAVVRLLSEIPVSSKQSRDSALLEKIQPVSSDLSLSPEQRKLFHTWDRSISASFARIKELLDQAETTLTSEKSEQGRL